MTEACCLDRMDQTRDPVCVCVLGSYPHRDRIGLLQDILHLISRESGLNLSSIHSRPDTKGGVRFYIEVEGHLEDAAVTRRYNSIFDHLQAAAQNPAESIRTLAVVEHDLLEPEGS